MSETKKIENPITPGRLRKIAAYLAPLAVVGGFMYGAVKYGEYATKQPKKTPVRYVGGPAFSAPKPNYDKMYIGHQGEDAAEIVEFTYPNVPIHSKKFIKLRNMVNNQMHDFDGYNQEHKSGRMVPLGQSAAIQLTKEAKIPLENTEAYYAGDYAYANKIAAKH